MLGVCYYIIYKNYIYHILINFLRCLYPAELTEIGSYSGYFYFCWYWQLEQLQHI